MLAVKKLSHFIGEDYAAYLIAALGSNGWVVAIMLASNDSRINVFNIGIARGVVMVVISYLLLRSYGMQMDFKKDFLRLNARNGIMVFHGLAMTGSVYFLELPLVYTVFNSGPIFVFIIDYFMFKTPVSLRQLLGIVICCIGITLSINSHLIYMWLGIQEDLHTNFHYVDASITTKLLVACFLLFMTMLWGYAIVVSKGYREANVVHTNLHLGIILVVFNGLGLIAFPSPGEVTFAVQAELLVKVGILVGVSSWMCNGSLFLSKKSGNISLMNFSTVLASYSISIMKYGETPNLLGVFASICIGVGIALVLIK